MDDHNSWSAFPHFSSGAILWFSLRILTRTSSPTVFVVGSLGQRLWPELTERRRVVLTGLARSEAEDFLSGFDGGNKEAEGGEHTRRGPSLGTGSTSTTVDINAAHASCTTRSGVCACKRGAGRAGTHPSANSTPPRASCSPVQPQIASMKVDTTAGRLTKTITASPVFLSRSTV